MRTLLIAEKDRNTRREMTALFARHGYRVVTAESVVDVLIDALNHKSSVILLGSEFGDFLAVELIPLLKRCNRNLHIIFVSDESSLPLLRKLRREGIFFHALKPCYPDAREELCQAVLCAFAHPLPPPADYRPSWSRKTLPGHALRE